MGLTQIPTSGYWGPLFPEVRSAEIKSVWSYSSIPSYAIVARTLVTYSNFTCFTLTLLVYHIV